MKKFLAHLLAGSALCAAPAETVWNTPETLGRWQSLKNVRYQVTENSAKLSGIGRDAAIMITGLELDPSSYNTLTYRYRATGVNPSRGQFYFANEGSRFTADRMWRLPYMIVDGKWHTVTVTVQSMADQNLWFKGGKITALRFDPTDKAGGEVEIAELKLSFVSGNGGDISKVQKSAVLWNSANKFAGWTADRNLTCQVMPGGLKLNLLKRDGRIINKTVMLDPQECNTFIYRYRASGTGQDAGQLFFAADGGKIAHNTLWRLPRLIADGKWHTAVVTADRLADAGAWFNAKRITMLRFDPTDSAGGEVEISEIRFEKRSDVKKKIDSASQAWQPLKITPKLDAPQWSAVKPGFGKDIIVPSGVTLEQKLKRTTPAGYFNGQMIYEANDVSPEQAAYMAKHGIKHTYSDFFLRKEFELKSDPVQGKVQIAADDWAELYINGQLAGSVKSWSEPQELDVKKFLRRGKNILAIHYRNERSAGGVLAELFVQFADKSFVRIDTDKTFIGTVTPDDNWNRADTDLSSYKPVNALPPPPAAPWTQKLSYKDYAAPQKVLAGKLIPQTAAAGETLQFSFDFSGEVPELPFSAELNITRNGNSLWTNCIEFTQRNITQLANGCWRLIGSVKLPLYTAGGECAVTLTSGSLYIADGMPVQKSFTLLPVKKIPGYEKAPVCVVKNGPYGAYFELNGKPFYHLAGRSATFYKPDPPINTVVVGPPWWEWWTPEGKLNLEIFDRCAEAARLEEGESYFVIDLTICVARALLAKYPDDICRDDHGEIVRDGYASRRDCHSFGSRLMLEEMRKIMLKTIDYLEKSPYANRIIGYRINGGHTIEWLGWSAARGRALDFSAAAQKAFKEFAALHYPALQDTSIPSLAERQTLDNSELIWDPAKHLKAIAHNEYTSDAVANYVIELCNSAKKAVKNRKLVGTYYGYTMTLNCDGKSQMRAHYALKKLLESRSVDFLMSPQPYNVRSFGETYGDMKPFATMKKYNIVPFHEDDTRTHLGKSGVGNNQAPNAELCVEALRRSMGFNLCRNLPLLYIPMPGSYEFPEARRDFQITQKVGQHCLEKQVPRKAEIALIASEKSVLYSPAKHPYMASGIIQQSYNPQGGISLNRRDAVAAFAGDSFGRNYNLWGRLGAPADYLLAEDIYDNPGDYKVYVFINAAFADKKLIEAARRLRTKDCLILWMYAPGYTAPDRNSIDNMKALTGLDFKKAPQIMQPALTMNDGRKMGVVSARMAPLFAVATPGVEVLGRYEDDSVGAAAYQTDRAVTVFCGVWRPDMAFLQDIARRAGIKLYSQSNDPLEANENLIAMHARSAGTKTVVLNRKCDILDVFNRQIIARNTDKFTFSAKLHESLLFYCGDDADELLKKIKDIK